MKTAAWLFLSMKVKTVIYIDGVDQAAVILLKATITCAVVKVDHTSEPFVIPAASHILGKQYS